MTEANNQNADIFKIAEDSPVHELVGEGKKFKTVDELAHGKQESDRYIDTLKGEKEELTALVENLKERLAAAQRTQPDPAQHTSPPTVSSDDLVKTVRDVIAEENAVQTRAVNLNSFEKEITKAFGDKAADKLREAANTTGMSVDQLKELAATTPEAAKRLVGIGAKASDEAPATKPKGESSERSATKATGVKSFDEWQTIRREKPNYFYSQEGQTAYINDMEKLKANPKM